MGAISRIKPEERCSIQRKICFFGHFGSANFGNEITLQSILHHLRLRLPEAEAACICTGPEALRMALKIETVPMSRSFMRSGRHRTRLAKWLRRVFIGAPSELYRWLDGFRTLKGTDMFIVPGTGLLTDAYGLTPWGPYSLFKWTLIAKLCGCKIFFVSVGAGPIYSRLGRYFVKSALSMADFRSYRDGASKAYLKGIGFSAGSDPVYPDLAFSLPETALPHDDERPAGRPVVGLGLMEYAGKYSVEKPTDGIYLAYLESLVAFAGWLLAKRYVIRLLIGDDGDRSALEEFKSRLRASCDAYDEERVIGQPAHSAEQLRSQIAATDIVVATRFHNVLLALLFDKPVLAISFHHKCASLMSDMSLTDYCHDINHMNTDRLIKQFEAIEKNAKTLKSVIRQRVEQSRKALDDQYELIFQLCE